jgi:hypothetical protein
MDQTYRKGQRVEHEVLGEGTITEDHVIEGNIEVGFSEVETYQVPIHQLKLKA